MSKLTPNQASLKKNEEFVYKSLLDRRKSKQPKLQVNDLVRVADLKRTFSECDTTNWSLQLYNITEFINETLPSYRFNTLPEQKNEALLKKTKLTGKENKDVMKKLNIT